MTKGLIALPLFVLSLMAMQATAEPLPQVTDVEVQPLLVHTHRLIEALNHLGAPLPEEVQRALVRASETLDDARSNRPLLHRRRWTMPR